MPRKADADYIPRGTLAERQCIVCHAIFVPFKRDQYFCSNPETLCWKRLHKLEQNSLVISFWIESMTRQNYDCAECGKHNLELHPFINDPFTATYDDPVQMDRGEHKVTAVCTPCRRKLYMGIATMTMVR